MSVAHALGAFAYQRHQPEHTVLYKIVQENLETFLKLVQVECGRPPPDTEYDIQQFPDFDQM